MGLLRPRDVETTDFGPSFLKEEVDCVQHHRLPGRGLEKGLIVFGRSLMMASSLFSRNGTSHQLVRIELSSESVRT